MFEQKALIADMGDSIFGKEWVKPPRELKNYRQYYNEDSTVGISIDTLSELVVGSGHYFVCKDMEDPNAGAMIAECERLRDKLDLNEKALNIVKCRYIYGFVPVERVIRRGPPKGLQDLQLLDPETVKYKRDNKGFKSFRQEANGEKIEFKPEEIIWFVNNEVGNSKGVMYGVSKVARVLDLLAIRDQIVQNINAIMRNQSRPPTVWRVGNRNDAATLRTILEQCRKTGKDPIVFPKDNVDSQTVNLQTRSPYWEYVQYVDSLIFEGLHAPMLNYLRNATEASAQSMIESINRHSEGDQRYMSRLLEKEVYHWHLHSLGYTENLPILKWGSPKAWLSEVKIDKFLEKGLDAGFIDKQQYFEILKQKGIDIPMPQMGTMPVSVAPDAPNGTVGVGVGTAPPPAQPAQPQQPTQTVRVTQPPPDKGNVKVKMENSPKGIAEAGEDEEREVHG